MGNWVDRQKELEDLKKVARGLVSEDRLQFQIRYLPFGAEEPVFRLPNGNPTSYSEFHEGMGRIGAILVDIIRRKPEDPEQCETRSELWEMPWSNVHAPAFVRVRIRQWLTEMEAGKEKWTTWQILEVK